MRKKNILTFAILLASIVAVAQNGVEGNKTLTIEDSTAIGHEVTPFSSPIPYSPSFNNPVHPNPYAKRLNTPTNWNLNVNSTIPKPRFLFSPFNQQVMYRGLGNYNNIGASFLWMSAKRLSVKGSAFVSKQYGFVLFSNQISYVVNLDLDYKLTNILQLKLYGQYLTPANQDPFIEASDLFPKTKTGAELTIKMKNNIKLGGGMEYQYNQKDQNWKPKTGAKVSIGF